jgi:hypothetical protein
VAEGGELRSQKRCESKPPLMAPQSRAYIKTNPRAAHGHSLGIKPHLDPKGRLVKKRGTSS